MKKVIIWMAGLMLAGMSLVIFYYQKVDEPVPAQLDKTLPGQVEEKREREELQPVYTHDSIGYSLQNNELNITYDNGVHWNKVPVGKDQLFEGEYSGNQLELIEGSYILSERVSAFIYMDGASQDVKRLMLVHSADEGKTWNHSVVSEQHAPIRYRKVAFLDDAFGYIIVSGGRTMSSEGTSVFLTNDGGQNWRLAADSGTTRLIYSGGFVDESIGFLSYGILNPEAPDLYVTQDGGSSWRKASFSIAPKYSKIFVTAEVPVKEDGGMTVLLNQGPTGDYKGGKVRAKFESNDHGLTWTFVEEVEPIEEG